jgi:class 3 adenylate cyclase/tetratricopeptide (TPR) repeat protein
MAACGNCGQDVKGDFVFCPSCGTELRPGSAAEATRERRKTVTVLFCDVTDSTALGESVDPEALRVLLLGYFVRLKHIVERHGGTVEKFIGDAVMAVFGVPVLHEDDPLRAVRAASEILEALPELGVQARVGVNTGEVVTGTDERLATGDAVNIAARLEKAAEPGTAMIGEETFRRVRDAVDAARLPPLELKGKSGPVAAYRLIGVRAEAARRLDTPMVGRERELRALRDAFARAAHDRSCQLFTILGAAGVGKSRLVSEFLDGIDARVVRGRCLSYGEGITYWPVVEVIQQLGELPDEATSAPLRSLLRESDEPTSAEEIAWAFRKLLEREARNAPLACVLDDLHWGEESFLDLVEHVADLVREAPILLLCMARPDLIERRPGWGGGKWNATNALLEPLDDAESEQLLNALGCADQELRGRISAAAEGNPLFLQEMVALVRESSGDNVAVPPTIQALLAARLDQLDPSERVVLERASVEGRVFHRSAVETLLDGEPELSRRLVSLVRKELIRSEPGHLDDDDEAYRFRHLLIRDAAYEALPKVLRAELHERFAEWVEARRIKLVERDEIVGHHLEQASRFKQDLGEPDATLAARAGEKLAAAGRRALWRGDNLAAAALLERAVELAPGRLGVSLDLDLASAQPTPPEAAAVAEGAADRARVMGDRPGEAAARVAAAFHRLLAGEAGVDELDALAHEALPLLDASEDHGCLVHVWSALGYGVANVRCRYAEWAAAAEQALWHARLADQRPTHLFSLDLTLVVGPTPADEAIEALDAVLPELPHPHPILFRSHLLAMLGRFDEAWADARLASERLDELSGGVDAGEYTLAEIATLEGDDETAARHLRGFCDFLTAAEQRGLLSTFAPMLGRSLCELGRYEEAEPQAQLGRELGEEHDIATQALWRQVQARVESHRGRHAEADALAREAVALIEQTDALNFQGAALSDLAEVLIEGGRAEDAHAPLAAAIERYERKRNLAGAARLRARFAAHAPTLPV